MVRDIGGACSFDKADLCNREILNHLPFFHLLSWVLFAAKVGSVRFCLLTTKRLEFRVLTYPNSVSALLDCYLCIQTFATKSYQLQEASILSAEFAIGRVEWHKYMYNIKCNFHYQLSCSTIRRNMLCRQRHLQRVNEDNVAFNSVWCDFKFSTPLIKTKVLCYEAFHFDNPVRYENNPTLSGSVGSSKTQAVSTAACKQQNFNTTSSTM